MHTVVKTCSTAGEVKLLSDTVPRVLCLSLLTRASVTCTCVAHRQQVSHLPLSRWHAGLWSQIKRAPKASKKRITFEVEGPAKAGAQALDERARQIFLYFKKYNYEVKDTGETIVFAGTYAASRGQAAALVFYVFCGERQYLKPLHATLLRFLLLCCCYLLHAERCRSFERIKFMFC